MFISEKMTKKVMRTLFIYVGVTLFIALFSTIYEMNSHNVYSAAMVFAFRYPLILGVGMYLVIRFMPTDIVPGILPASVYAFGVGISTMRSIFIGVLEIYGTTNKNMVMTYTIFAWIFIILGVGSYLFILIYGTIKKHKEEKEQPTGW